MNLPDIYARVCAVRPELAVYDKHRSVLTWADGQPAFRVGFVVRDSEGKVSDADCLRFIDDETAAALILARWVEALPFHVSLQLTFGSDGKEWRVSGWIGEDECDRYGATPIEALAAFYLGETK